MKILHIAWKDLTLAYRRLFLIGMALVAPMLMAFIFSSAFGGSSDEFEISRIDLGVVNLDEASYGFSAGDMLMDFLSGENLTDLLNPTSYITEQEALEAILNQEIQAAVIIPADVSESVTGQVDFSEIQILHDPAAILAPQLIESILQSMASGLSGAKITSDVTLSEIQRRGLDHDPELIQKIVAEYTHWAQENSGDNNAYQIVHPENDVSAQKGVKEQIISGVMASMMIFFTFFTGAYGAGTILDEEEDGTLARKFASPSKLSVILGGKFLGVFFILLLQMMVLILLSTVVFKVDWGGFLSIAIAIFSTTTASAGLGIFLLSLVKNRNQTGFVYGGVMTILGMGGGLFTGGIENPPQILKIIEGFTPQGWSNRVWLLTQRHATVLEMFPDAGILLLMGVVLFSIGVFLFRRRYAK